MPPDLRTRLRKPSRREVVIGGVGLTAGAAGTSTGALGSWIGGGDFEQVSLTIKTAPADADERAMRIAQHLASNLESAGISATVVPKALEELRRDVLVDGSFDLYVDRLPLGTDPDFLRPLLHSRYLERSGWYNPYGFADLEVDELLMEQRRRDGVSRQVIVDDLLEQVAAKQPFAPIAVPDDIAAVRRDRFVGWSEFPIASPLRYVGLETAGESRVEELSIAITDDRVTRNLNPLAVRFRERGTVTGLLYEPLARRIDGDMRPWLAEDWRWTEGEETACELTLRPSLSWHDSRSLTADDVAFTYAFVADTSLGAADADIPAPHLFGRSSLVESVDKLDGRTLRIAFGETSETVSARALTVPIVPRHVWEPKASVVDGTSTGSDHPTTAAIAWDNPEPVGSGPLSLTQREPEEQLVLESTGAPALRGETTDPKDRRLAFDRLRLQVAPSAQAAVELAANGTIDGTMNLVDGGVVPRIGTEDSLSLHVDRQSVLYHVGFNVRREYLTNPHFRRAMSRLIDKAYVTESIMGGYATPAASPFPSQSWTPAGLEWSDGDPTVPFTGDNGTADPTDSRDMFREMGYDYHDGKLVGP